MAHGARPRLSDETLGFVFGLIGVLIFSLSLPMTRVAVASLDPTFVGLGRAIVAAILAGAMLLITRQQLPTRGQVRSLIIVALGVVIGFPLLSAWALRQAPASHGAIVVGLAPLATALFGAVRAGERPSARFWIAGTIGSATVVIFVWLSGGGGLRWPDLALIGAVLAVGLGYAEGGRLAREMGSWQVICWALVISAPALIVPVSWSAIQYGLNASLNAWLAFGYLSVFSMFLGFFAWYRGLALGGIARVGQVQLLQAFFTIGWAALLLHEEITPLTLLAAVIVVVAVAVGRRAPIRR